MRILFLSQLLPLPLDAGPKVRAFHVIEHLTARGHRVTVVARSRRDDDPQPVASLRESCWRVHTEVLARSRPRDLAMLLLGPLRRLPWSIDRDASASLRRKIAAVVREEGPFDAIHADQLAMAEFAFAARDAQAESPATLVLDQHNAVHRVPALLAAQRRGWPRAWLRGEARRLLRYEKEVCRRMDRVIWVSAEDRAAVLGATAASGEGVPDEAATVIPICIDPGPVPPPRRPSADRVSFVGGMHWPPNRDGVNWFHRRVWPRIVAAGSEARLTVLGKAPPPGLRRDPAATAPGFVADLEPYLGETAAFVVPLLSGAGMRVKILDAWARGLAVVSTSVGAEGIAAVDGSNLLLADGPADFAAAVLRLLGDPELRRRIGDAGRSTVESTYDWRVAYGAWDRVYEPPAGAGS